MFCERDGIALADAARGADRLPVLAHEVASRNRTDREPVPWRDGAGDHDLSAAGKAEAQTRLDRALGDGNVIGGVDDNRVLRKGCGGRVILRHGVGSLERSILSQSRASAVVRLAERYTGAPRPAARRGTE